MDPTDPDSDPDPQHLYGSDSFYYFHYFDSQLKTPVLE